MSTEVTSYKIHILMVNTNKLQVQWEVALSLILKVPVIKFWNLSTQNFNSSRNKKICLFSFTFSENTIPSMNLRTRYVQDWLTFLWVLCPSFSEGIFRNFVNTNIFNVSFRIWNRKSNFRDISRNQRCLKPIDVCVSLLSFSICEFCTILPWILVKYHLQFD